MLDDDDGPVAGWGFPGYCGVSDGDLDGGAVGLIDRCDGDGFGLDGVGDEVAAGGWDAVRDDEGLHAELRVLGGELAAGEATGIARVVDDPDAHVALLCLLNQDAEELEVGVGEIAFVHAVAGLGGDSGVAEGLHGVEVALDDGLVDGAVEAVVRIGAVLGWRRLPCLVDFGSGWQLELLPRLRSGGGERKDGDRQAGIYRCALNCMACAAFGCS